MNGASMSRRSNEFYPRVHKHIVEWTLILLLLRGAYDVVIVMVFGSH